MSVFKNIALLLSTFLIAQGVFAQRANQLPVIDAYITIEDPLNLNTVRVNIEKSFDPDGRISRTEVNFGDGFQSTQLDTKHTYTRFGRFLVTIRVWDNQNAVQVLQRFIEPNSDYKLADIVNSNVLGPISAEKKKYSFGATPLQTDQLYKFTMIRTKNTNMIQNAFVFFLNFFRIKMDLNTFTFAAAINGINIFAYGEINQDTLKIEKFISLKATNELAVEWESKKYNSVEISINRVQLIRESVPPRISISPNPTGPTNIKTYSILIEDESRVSTFLYINGSANQSNSKSIGFIIQSDGINVIKVETVDSFGNRSAPFRVEINLDTKAPLVTNLSPSEGTTVYTSRLPHSFNVTAVFSEVMQSVSIKQLSAALSADKISASAAIEVDSDGQQNILITGSDLAGNLAIKTLSLNVKVWNTAPLISLGLQDGAIIRNSFAKLPVTVTSEIPTSAKIKLNGVEVFITAEKIFEFNLQNLIEGANYIQVLAVDSAGNFSEVKTLSVFVDTRAPTLVSLSPAKGKVFYTNTLPFIIPVQAVFDEALNTASLNSAAAFLSGPSTVSGQIQVNQAGQIAIQIEVSDYAGNVTVVSEIVTVAFSTTKPTIILDDNVINLLTNKINTNITGSSNYVLVSANLNGSLINVDSSGKRFSGIFQAPKDGRFLITVNGTDQFGNIGTATTYIRVIQALPDVLENYPPPTFRPKGPIGYIPNYGPGFKDGPGGDICKALKGIFNDSTEFSDNLRNISTTDPQPFLDRFPKDYPRPKIADIHSVQDFIGDVDEKLNHVKAAYLAVCEGYDFMLGSDCPESRLLFRLLTGNFPEPVVVRAIPGLTVPIQNFLIKRLNFCTGLDTSDLTCSDLVELLPGLANYAVPALGDLLSSPVAQFLLEEAACKDICEGPLSNSPACKDFPIPKLPVPGGGTIITLNPDLGDGPGVPGGNEFPDTGSGDGCKWWESCGDGDDDGGGEEVGEDLLCSVIPGLWFCVDGDPRMPDTIPLDRNIDCNTLKNLNLLDIFNPVYNGGSSVTFLTSIVSNCLKTPVDGFPKLTKPVITLITPVGQQLAAETVRVSGSVNDISSEVKINGLPASVSLGLSGVDFDIEIPTPADGIVRVDAVDSRGNQADPVQVSLLLPEVVDLSGSISSGYGHACVIRGGALKCLGQNSNGQLGNGANTDVNIPVAVSTLGNLVSQVTAGIRHTCAIVKSGEVYCWGSNDFGQLGNGLRLNSNIPVKVVGLPEKAKTVTAGFSHSCALLVNGNIMCWGGEFGVGELGNPAFTNTSLPVAVVNLTKVKALGTGALHNCAIDINDELYCWGLNNTGQVGDGSFSNRFVPTKVLNIGPVQVLGVGSYHSCAQSNGQVFCWGANNSGQLGNGTNSSSAVPIAIAVTNSELINGKSTTCSFTAGIATCWGDNTFGQLGDGTSITKLQPVTLGLTGIKAISSGDLLGCAFVADKTMCWGIQIFSTPSPKIIDGF